MIFTMKANSHSTFVRRQFPRLAAAAVALPMIVPDAVLSVDALQANKKSPDQNLRRQFRSRCAQSEQYCGGGSFCDRQISLELSRRLV
jgi:hypothetical protein